jgi:hypothetical protein
MTNQGVIAKKENYNVEVKYSPEATDKKLVKFTLTKGDNIEISADELIGILTEQVNMETLAPAFVETDKVNVVEVGRQLQCVLDRDMKKGEKININYTHPLPIEFALIEEAYKIASIKKDVKVFELTKEYLESVQKKITPKMKDYIEKFYKSFKNIKVGK